MINRASAQIIKKSMLFLLIISTFFLTACGNNEIVGIMQTKKIFLPDVCIENGTYCHYMVTDQEEVNLTFNTADPSDDFYYNITI